MRMHSKGWRVVEGGQPATAEWRESKRRRTRRSVWPLVIALLVIAGSTSADDKRAAAHQALRDLASVVEGGAANHQEYMRRVNDARIIVDRYLKPEPANDAKTGEYRTAWRAMEYFSDAAKAWGGYIRNDKSASWPVMAALCDDATALDFKALVRNKRMGMIVANALWKCAARDVAKLP